MSRYVMRRDNDFYETARGQAAAMMRRAERGG
jgi:hypothetical protein